MVQESWSSIQQRDWSSLTNGTLSLLTPPTCWDHCSKVTKISFGCKVSNRLMTSLNWENLSTGRPRELLMHSTAHGQATLKHINKLASSRLISLSNPTRLTKVQLQRLQPMR